MSGQLNPVKLLRSISRELRLAFPQGHKIQPSPALTFLVGQFKKNKETQEQYCKHREDMVFLADTYNTYLGAQRQWRTVQQEYHAAGERTVASTAQLVGLNLPHEPKIFNTKPKPVQELKPVGYHPQYK